jgi:hypothetical protein
MLKALSRLLDVQRVQRTGAEAALAQAQEAERLARASEAEARQEADAAQKDWLRGLAEPGFSPEYQRALAARLIARERQGADCAVRTERASEATEERREAWRTTEARVRSGERGARKLRRTIGRREEERRLGALADRTTTKWTRS